MLAPFHRIVFLSFLLAISFPSVLWAQNKSWFEDVTTKLGFSTTTTALRLASCDINNDNYPDFIYIRDHSTPNDIHVFLNRDDPNSTDPGDRLFEDISVYSGVNMDPFDSTDTRKADHFVLGDFNNDGNVDMATGVWWYSGLAPHGNDRCEVLLGDGTGRFDLVKENGLHELGKINSTSMALLDYNLDGNIDIYIATWFLSDRSGFEQDYLMEGNGDGTFTNVSDAAGISGIQFPMHGATATDWNNDGWPDIFTAPYCRSGGSLLKNNGNGTFTDVASIVGYSAQHSPGDGGRAACQWGAYSYDYDNDGDFDILQTIVHGGIDPGEARTNINTNNGPPLYTLQHDYNSLERNGPQTTHIGNMDAAWFDMNNDGLVDLSITEAEYNDRTDRAYFYLQTQAGTLKEITSDLGLDQLIRSPHSCEVLDYDLDGDYDYVTNHLRSKSKGKTHLLFFENKIGQENNWLGIQLNPPKKANRKAIGAKIKVWTNGLVQTVEIQAGRGHFSGQQPYETLVGVGKNNIVDSLIVEWPTYPRSRSVFNTVGVNQYILIDSTLLTSRKTIEPIADKALIHVYPNPASDYFMVGVFNFKPLRIQVFSLKGTLLVDMPYSSKVNVNDWPNGMYVVHVTGNSATHIERIVVLH